MKAYRILKKKKIKLQEWSKVNKSLSNKLIYIKNNNINQWRFKINKYVLFKLKSYKQQQITKKT